jgi:signal transduction histidine kinase/ligand-binding sensor domain-containing protein
MNRKHKYILPLLLLAACTNHPRGDGTLPVQLHPQPNVIEANPEGGYLVNPATGDSIKPLISSSGDTIITGVPITTRGKLINPNSVAKPKEVKTPKKSELNKFNAHPNYQKIPDNLISIPVDESRLKTITIPIVMEDDTTHYLINSTGQRVPTGRPIPAIGKIVRAIYPKPIKALPPAFKDAAITDIQYMDIDQGMASSFIRSILEDKNGNLWFGTLDGGVSMYNGESFIHFTEKEGLSNNSVRSILEDRNGNLWFGTFGGGVSMYDGESFIHFTEKEGLSHNLVVSIIEDRSGNLWFGTWGGGVSMYKPPTNDQLASFTHFTEKEGLSNNVVRSILEDKQGNLWFGTWGGGVSRYDGKSFIHFTEKEGLSNNVVLSIIEDYSGNLWFGTDGGGVSMYKSPKYGQLSSFIHFTEKEGLSGNAIVSVIEDKSKNLWFGTNGGGVSMYNGKSFIHFSEKEGLSNNLVYTMIEDKSGNLWFGTWGGGVSMYNSESFIHFSEKEGLSNNSVWSVVEDKSGNLWFGTWGGGVCMYDGESFIHFTEKEGLSHNRVVSVMEDKSGNLWFGTWGGGVSMYNGESFTHFTEKEGLSSNVVRSILEDRNGNLWFGTWEGGISMYKPPKDGQKAYFTHFTEKEGLSSNSVLSIIEDKSGNIWFGNWGGGVSMLVMNNDSGCDVATIIHFTEKEGLSHNRVVSIVEDKSGNFWFGTDGGGVNMYKPRKDDQMATFTHFGDKEGLSHNIVRSVVEDKNGSIYISSERGLTQIIPKVEGLGSQSQYDKIIKKVAYTLKGYGKQDGLKGLHFYSNSAFLDSKNRVWWGSDKSLTMLDLNNYQPTQNPPVIHLKQLDINEQFIDYRNLSNSLSKALEFDSVQKFENFPLNLKIPYNKNHLTFHTVGIDWAAPHKIRYSYRMLGINNNWSTPTPEAKADYRNLPFGTYTLQVRAIGESGEWSMPVEYYFTIRPPWWHSWWAYSIYFLVLLLIVWRVHLFQKERTIKKEREKTRKRELQQAKQIEKAYYNLELAHENLKSTQAQLVQQEKLASLGQLTAGIAHEIQNPLNFVNNFAEVNGELIEEANQELTVGTEASVQLAKEILTDIKQNLEKINHHGKRADAIVKGMLQHSRNSAGQKEPTDINALADEYLRLSYHGLRAKDKSFNADYKTDFDPNLPKVEVVSQDIGRVMLNLINNAFYACAERSRSTVAEKQKTSKGSETPSGLDYKPTVTVSTKNLGHRIEISVKDNGPGIPEEIKDKIFQPFFTTKAAGEGTGLGLSLSYDIITKGHGGDLKVESKVENGTEFIILLPINL